MSPGMGDDMGDGMGDAMGGGSSSSAPPPTITSISPSSAVLGAAALLLTITGTNFDGSTTVTFGGNSTTVNDYSSTTLYVIVLPSWLDVAGSIPVVVSNGGGSASTTFTVVAHTLAAPLTATTTPTPVVIRAGNTSPSFTVLLADASGPVDISSDSPTLHLRAVWGLTDIPGGTVVATTTKGQATCTLPTLWQPGFYYGYIDDGNGNSFPDTGAGFLIVVAPSTTP